MKPMKAHQKISGIAYYFSQSRISKSIAKVAGVTYILILPFPLLMPSSETYISPPEVLFNDSAAQRLLYE
jgi:hypothetical protein